MAYWLRVLAQEQSPTLLTCCRRDLDQPINFLLRLQLTPVSWVAGLATRAMPQGATSWSGQRGRIG
jgi:hypothetical protein